MKIEREEYAPTRTTIHIGLILEYLLTCGSITHEECEKFTEDRGHKCTVLRSRMPEIRLNPGFFWPIYTKMEKHPGGSHARYFMDFEVLAAQAGVAISMIKPATLAWRAAGRILYHKGPFLDWLSCFEREAKAKDLRSRHALYRHQAKTNPDQLGFGLTIDVAPAAQA